MYQQCVTSTVLPEPEAGSLCISGSWGCTVLQQSGRECDPTLCGWQNWLFCDCVKGAESSAIVYALVEVAKANEIELYDYLMLVLTMLPYLGKSPAHGELEKLMPEHIGK